MIHSTSFVIAPAMAPKKSTSALRSDASMCRDASAKTKANTMSGSIAPSAAALTTFAGTSAVTHAANPGSCAT